MGSILWLIDGIVHLRENVTPMKRAERRWEFMRRHEDCRADFLPHKDGTDWFDQEGGSGFSFDGDRRLRPDEPGFVAAVPNRYKKYLRLRGLPNPAIGDQPVHIIWFLERRPEMVPYPWDGINPDPLR